MATKQETLWFGYLEAGKKSGPVVRDVTLGTGTETTFYLFSLNRGAILEYRRDIAEPKLRELTEEEMEGGTLWRRLWLGVAGYGVEAFFLQLVRVELDFSRGSMKLKRDTFIGVDGLFLTVDHAVFF